MKRRKKIQEEREKKCNVEMMEIRKEGRQLEKIRRKVGKGEGERIEWRMKRDCGSKFVDN